MMTKVKIINTSAVQKAEPLSDLANIQNTVSKKLSEMNIYTTNFSISMTAGKYPDVTIEGVLNTELWPK
ncbi:MAG: hypothetical protein V3V00_11845 [Saprospiraceae bacterium]